MANHHLNHLTFYGIAISSVLALFKVVSAYGEGELSAPVNIDGTYQLKSESLVSCLQGRNLELDIEQSGIYLFGNLILGEGKQADFIPLSGELNDEKVSLSGQGKSVAICPELKQQALTVEATIQERQIVGDLKATQLQVSFQGTKKDLPKQENLEH